MLTPWEEYLKKQSKEYQRILEEKQNAPVNKDVQFLAGTFFRDGKEEMMIQFDKIVKAKKLTMIEVVMMSDKLKNILVNNGFIIHRNKIPN